MRVALADPAPQPLAAALPVPGTGCRPRRQVLGRRKAAHGDADLGDDGSCRDLTHPRNRLQHLHRLLERDHAPLHLRLRLLIRLLQEVDVRQVPFEQDKVVRLHSALQSLAQSRQFLPQPSPG